MLDVLEFMNDACDVPILVDADTGYGNFNNARRLVRKLEERGIAGTYVQGYFVDVAPMIFGFFFSEMIE